MRLLSPDRGVFSAFAFGGSKSRRRFSGCLDMFNEVLFKFKETRQGEYVTLQEGVLLNSPRRLREDWQRLGIAVNCARFVEAFGAAPDGAPVTHDLFIRFLRLLENSEKISPVLPVFFRARLAFEQGYALNPESCARCGADLAMRDTAMLPVREGFFLCPDCVRKTPPGPYIILSRAGLDALRGVLRTPPDEWISPLLASDAARQCARALDSFIQHHTGLFWEGGRFRKG